MATPSLTDFDDEERVVVAATLIIINIHSGDCLVPLYCAGWLAGQPTNFPFLFVARPRSSRAISQKIRLDFCGGPASSFSRRSVALLLLRLLFALFVLVSNIGPEGFLVNIPDYYYNYYYYYTMLLYIYSL
jgi:hypothetical protein